MRVEGIWIQDLPFSHIAKRALTVSQEVCGMETGKVIFSDFKSAINGGKADGDQHRQEEKD